MSQSQEFDFRLNRRKLLQMGGAACCMGLWPQSSFAQLGGRRPVCLQVEPWYAAELAKIGKIKNSRALPLTKDAVTKLADQNFLKIHGFKTGPSKSNKSPANSPILHGIHPNFQNAVAGALSKSIAGQSLAPAERAIMDRLKIWPKNSSLSYSFVMGDVQTGFGESLSSIVKAVFDEWSKYCGLNFIPAQTGRESDAFIRISFVAGAGHYSLIGTDSKLSEASPNNSGRFESLNLDPSDAGFVNDRDWTVSRARHEIGHSIGFCHEQANPDHRIVWNEPEVFRVLEESQGWSDDAIRQNVLNVLDDPSEFVNTIRDPKSIMHYSFPASCIISSGGVDVPDMDHPNLVLSPVDIDFCRKQYGIIAPDDPNSPPNLSTTPAQTDRQKLKAADAIALTADSDAVSGEFPDDPQMHLYKIGGVSGDFVFETVDGARVNTDLTAAMPVVLELFDGTDFSENEIVDKGVSQFGAFDPTDVLKSSLGVQDAFLPYKLKSGTTYYLLVRPQQRLPKNSKGTYKLLFRHAKSDRVIDGTWAALRDTIRTLQDSTASLQKGVR
jgi:hypothetical protein